MVYTDEASDKQSVREERERERERVVCRHLRVKLNKDLENPETKLATQQNF